MAEIALRYEGKKVAREQRANRATVLPCRPMQSEFRSWHNNTIKHRSYFGFAVEPATADEIAEANASRLQNAYDHTFLKKML